MRLALLSAALAALHGVLAAQCGPKSACPASSPCCSHDGQCGSGAAQCAVGCQPMYSFTPTSCVANAVCQPIDVSITPDKFNDNVAFRPLLNYNGDSSQSTFVFESGYLGAGQDGVLLEMTSAHDSVISSTKYMLYGRATARLRHNATAGLVTTFGLQSDMGDSITFRLGGTNTSRVATNFGALSHSPSALGLDESPARYDMTLWHNYTIDWTPTNISWAVDDAVVRTVQRTDAGTMFPRAPARVLLTATGIGAGATQQERAWANGELSFKDPGYLVRGYFAHEFSHMSINCASLELSNVSVTGVGSEPIAYFYTGKNSSVSSEPEFALTRDQIQLIRNPSQDGRPGTPGYPGASPQGPEPNMYAGGGGSLSTSTSAGAPTSTNAARTRPTTGVSNGIKIGIPVALGGALLLGLLGILALYLWRRKRARARANAPPPADHSAPPMGIHPPGQPPSQQSYDWAYPVSVPTSYATWPSTPAHAPAHTPAYPATYAPATALTTNTATPVPLAPVPADESHAELLPTSTDGFAWDDDDAAKTPAPPAPPAKSPRVRAPPSPVDRSRELYYQDPYASEPSYDAISDDFSEESGHRPHMHYAGHGALTRFHPYLSAEENEQYAVQDAWEELRYQALGPDDTSFFQSSASERSQPHARRASKAPRARSTSRRVTPGQHTRHRSAYTRGGASSYTDSSGSDRRARARGFDAAPSTDWST